MGIIEGIILCYFVGKFLRWSWNLLVTFGTFIINKISPRKAVQPTIPNSVPNNINSMTTDQFLDHLVQLETYRQSLTKENSKITETKKDLKIRLLEDIHSRLELTILP